ncbi:PAS domain-containing protein [Paracoccus sp. (in: a-proteobacteria)]|uniref:PAS domain-containing protein n=1 Tax=Paracoccus sp. TaxID=267 RepID=UPI003A85A935
MADFDRTNPSRLLIEMREYWQSLRQGRAIPARSEIEPRSIHRSLDYAFILERIAPGAARFRLAGRHLIDLMGMEVRGMPLCAVLNPSSRGRLSDVLESVFKAPQIVEMTLTARGEYARPELHGKMLLLPLKSDLGDVTRALGCLISDGELGVAPRRFDLVSETITPVVPGGTVLKPSPSMYGLSGPQSGALAGATARKKPQPSPRARITEADSPEQRRAMFRVVADGQA